MRHVGRKLFHVLGGLGLLAVYFVLGRPRAFWAYGALLALALGFDALRLALPALNAWLLRRFRTLLREAEAGRITGSPTYIIGVGAALWLYPEPAALAAVLFLVCGDVSATAVGEAWGRTRLRGKSLEGTAAFAVAALLAGLVLRALLHAPTMPVLAAGALTAALVELLLPSWANDNLLIPLVSGGVMALLT